MKSFYEKSREDSRKIVVNRNDNHRFPLHFHRNLEILLLRKGEYEVFINGERYSVSSGQIAVIDSYDVHGYSSPMALDGEQDSCVVLIPYEYLGTFNARRKNLRVAASVFTDENLCDELLKIIDEYLVPRYTENVRRASVELFLALLFEKLQFTEEKGKDEVMLVRNMLAYIHENFQGDVSRGALAKALGYTEAHLSRVFHRYLKKRISEYVNELRLDYIERARENGDERTAIELIYEAGFNSQQTYYRFKKKSLR